MTQPLIRVLQIESDELNLRIHTVIQTEVVLDEISDVVAPTPTLGEALLWSGSPQQWRPGVVAGSGTGGSGIISTTPQVGDLVVYGEGNAGSPIGSPVTYRNQSTIQFINDRFLVKGVTATNFGSPRYGGSPQVLIAGSPANKTSLEITSSVPGLMFYDTDAPANEKSWRFVVDNGDFIGEIRSDSGKTANHWIELTRSGNAISDLQLYVGQQEQAIHAIAGAAVEFYHNNINVAETTTAAGGGLRVNNLATGAGFERVLTTSDISSGGGSAGSPLLNIRGGDGIDVTFGSPKVSIAVDGTVARLAGSPITTINSDSFALNQTLRIYDGGNTDYADFSHDGTDFNTAFTNTTDWNITESGVDITVPGAGGARTEQVVVRGAHTTAGSGEGKALFEINQSTASGNTPVFAVYRTGTNLLNLDNDGDLTVSQSIGIGSGFVISNNAVAQYIAYNQAGANQGHLFHTTSAILTRGRVTMGQYTANTEVLTSSQDFNELTIRRDWDGGAGSPLTNTSAGASLRIERDIINSTDTGTFLEWADDTLGELGYIDKDGVLNIGGSPAILLTTTAGAGGLQVRNTLTGTGLERVLTTSDLDTGSPLGLPNIVGGAGITVTTGSPQFTVDVDATVLRTTSSITDLADVDTAGVLENQVLTYAGSPLGWIPVTGAGGSGGGDSVFAGDGISIAAGSPLSNKTISVNTTVLRTSSNLDDLANVIGSPTVAGDTLYFDGTNWNTLAAGTAGQILTMGSPLLPTWKPNQGASGGGSPLLNIVGGDGIDVTYGSPKVNVAVDDTVTRMGTGSPPNGRPNVGTLRISDAGLTDYADFSHDGTNFNIDFTNTDRWDIGSTGFTAVRLVDDTDLDQRDGATFFQRDAGNTNFWSSKVNGTAVQYGTLNIAKVEYIGVPEFWFRDGAVLRIYDAGDTDYAAFSHDGADFNTNFTNTAEWNIGADLLRVNLVDGVDLRLTENGTSDYIEFQVGGSWNIVASGVPTANFSNFTDYIWLRDGANLRHSDTSDANYIEFSHDGSGSYNLAAVAGTTDRFWVRDGMALRISDSGDTDYAEFNHDGTDFNLAFVNTRNYTIGGTAGSPSKDALVIIPGSPQTQGMLVRNLVTGTGLERVLTTSDLDTGSPLGLPNIVGGTGITVTTGSPQFTITNSDPNVDQNLWLNIAGDVGGPVAANTTTDTLTIAGGTRTRTNIAGDTVTINMTGSPIIGQPTKTTTVVAGSPITLTAIASHATASYRSAEFLVQAVRGNNFHTTKLLAVHDGTNASYTEFSTVTLPSFFGSPAAGSPTISGEQAIYSVDVNGGNLRLLATPREGTGSITFKVDSTLITV